MSENLTPEQAKVMEKVVSEVKNTQKEVMGAAEKKPVAKKPVEKKSAEKKPVEKKEAEKKIAIIRIRGIPGIRWDIKDTLNMLKLHKKHFCVVIENTHSMMGMVKKCKDYITWGEISDEVLKELISKRSEPNPKDKE